MNSTELKAMAYDLIAQIEFLQGQLRDVNQGIAQKLEEEKKAAEEKKKADDFAAEAAKVVQEAKDNVAAEPEPQEPEGEQATN